MKFNKRILCAILLSGFALASAAAQRAWTASGGDGSGTGGSMSYSIGQVICSADTGTSGSVAAGIQHPYEIFSLGVDEAGNQISLTVFPNPAKDLLTLKVDKRDYKNLGYQLYDISGSLLEDKKLAGNETKINMGNLRPAIYFLEVTEHGLEVKTFKIVKY